MTLGKNVHLGIEMNSRLVGQLELSYGIVRSQNFGFSKTNRYKKGACKNQFQSRLLSKLPEILPRPIYSDLRITRSVSHRGHSGITTRDVESGNTGSGDLLHRHRPSSRLSPSR